MLILLVQAGKSYYTNKTRSVSSGKEKKFLREATMKNDFMGINSVSRYCIPQQVTLLLSCLDPRNVVYFKARVSMRSARFKHFPLEQRGEFIAYFIPDLGRRVNLLWKDHFHPQTLPRDNTARQDLSIADLSRSTVHEMNDRKLDRIALLTSDQFELDPNHRIETNRRSLPLFDK